MSAILVDNILWIVIVFLIHTKGNHLFAGNSLHCLAGVYVIPVINNCLCGHLSKLMEGSNDVVQRLKVFQMVSIYIEDNCNIRMAL